jgi:hypothetical protein
MGLRIIGRQHRRQEDVTDTERLNLLEHEADNWMNARGSSESGQNARDRLIAHYKSARERVHSPDEIQEMARRARVGIMMDTSGDKTPHLRVDIATLLELL